MLQILAFFFIILVKFKIIWLSPKFVEWLIIWNQESTIIAVFSFPKRKKLCVWRILGWWMEFGVHAWLYNFWICGPIFAGSRHEHGRWRQLLAVHPASPSHDDCYYCASSVLALARLTVACRCSAALRGLSLCCPSHQQAATVLFIYVFIYCFPFGEYNK